MKHDPKRELSDVIERLAETDRSRKQLHRKMQRLRDHMGVIHARFVIEIGTARDDKGKAVHSNEQLRNAALTLKLHDDAEYQKLREEFRALTEQDEELAIEHNRLVDNRTILMLELGLAPPSGDEIPMVN